MQNKKEVGVGPVPAFHKEVGLAALGRLYRSETYLADAGACAHAVVPLAGATVLVTGSGGLVGSMVADALACAGARVVTTGSSASRVAARFEGSPWPVEVAELDVCMPIALDLSVDAVVHAASPVSPKMMMESPTTVIRANASGTVALLDWARSHGAERFLLVSSGEVYGQMPASCPPFRKSDQGYVDPMAPRSCYPVAKRLAESACACFAREFGMRAVSVRLCHTYGPTMVDSDTRVASQLLRDAAAGRPLALGTPGAQERSWLHVADAASGILTALASGEAGHAYNVASMGSVCTIAELARDFGEAAGVPVSIPEAHARPDKDETPITRQVLDPSAIEALGWHARYGIGEGVSAALAALREASVPEGD